MERAKIVRKQLRELYEERNRVKVGTGRERSKEEFTSLKEEYFRLVNVDNKEIVYPTLTINRSVVVQAGKLEEQMGEPKQEVLEANKSVNMLQMTMGDWQGQQGDTWQVVVPYGSKCGRAVGGERGPGNRSW